MVRPCPDSTGTRLHRQSPVSRKRRFSRRPCAADPQLSPVIPESHKSMSFRPLCKTSSSSIWPFHVPEVVRGCRGARGAAERAARRSGGCCGEEGGANSEGIGRFSPPPWEGSHTERMTPTRVRREPAWRGRLRAAAIAPITSPPPDCSTARSCCCRAQLRFSISSPGSEIGRCAAVRKGAGFFVQSHQAGRELAGGRPIRGDDYPARTFVSTRGSPCVHGSGRVIRGNAWLSSSTRERAVIVVRNRHGRADATSMPS